MIQNAQSKSLGMHFRPMNLEQAGLRLRGLAAGSPWPLDHLRVAQFCSTCKSVDEVEREARAVQEFSIDVDDALAYIRSSMLGQIPLSDAEAAQIDAENNAKQEENGTPTRVTEK